MKKKLTQFILGLLPLLIFVPKGQAQLVINEVSTSNINQIADNYNEYEDWIELYNGGGAAINLTGYYLSDNPALPLKWQFPAGVSIPAGGFRLIWASDRDEVVGNNIHTNFKLTQMQQEPVILSDPAGNIIDQLQLTVTTKGNHSRGRQTNGSPTWKVFRTSTPGASNNGQTSYVGYTPSVVFDLPAGFYPPPGVFVQLSCPDPNANIFYTIDGSEPTQASIPYTGPLVLANNTVVRAKAYGDPNLFISSFTGTNSYFINTNHDIPVVSVCGNYQGLFNGFPGNPDIGSTIEFFDENKVLQFEMEGEARGHGHDTWAFDQKNFRFHAQDQYGYANKIDYPIFKTSPRSDFDAIIFRGGGNDNYPNGPQVFGVPGAFIRDAFSQTLAEAGHMNLDTRKLQYCAVYINMQYWGLYEIRERVDKDYAKYYYDQEEPDIDMLQYYGGLTVQHGSDTAWYNLSDFIQQNNMAVQANYDYVKSKLDVLNFIDYFILCTFTVNSDWLNWNTMWWRGREAPGVKWRYALWDMDNTFDLGQNYTGLPTTGYDNDPCSEDGAFPNNPEITHSQMLSKLFDNEEFFSLYITRYADLLNTTFNCDYMNHHMDSLFNIFATEMPNQIARWGGTMQEWQTNVQYIRDQINGRCAFINGGIVDCYQGEGVTGPYPITVVVDPPLSGNVIFNTNPLNAYPWTGNYFGGVNINLTGLPNNGWAFDYWELANHAVAPNANADQAILVLTQTDTLIAHFVQLGININAPVTTLCVGGSTTLVATGGNTFNWTIDGDPNVIGTNDTLVVSPNVTTTYIVSNNFGSDTVTVTVNALPTPSLPANPSICANDAFTFDATQLGATYLWQNGATTAAITANQAGTYTVTVTLNGCTATATSLLNVNALPVLNIPAATSICQGQGTVLDATNAGATYLWQDGATDATYTANQAGTYAVTVTLNGCSASASTNLAVNPAPAVNLPAVGSICQGNAFALDATNAGASYLWQDGSTNAVYTATQAGTYNVTVTVGACTATGGTTLNVNPLPVVNLPAQASICDGDLLNLPAFNQGATYVWQDGSTDDHYAATQTGTYAVTVTLNGCTTTGSTSLTVNPLPVVNMPAATSICQGESVTYDATNVGASYIWADGATTATITADQTGTYAVTVTVNGCTTQAFAFLTVNPMPVIDLGQAQTFCAGENVNLDATVAGATYVWQDGSDNAIFVATATGSYHVEVDLSGCRAYDTINLVFDPTPSIDLGTDRSFCIDQPITLDATFAGASYLWNDGSVAPQLTVNQSGIYAVTVSVNNCSTTDAVVVTGEDCSDCVTALPNSFTPNGDGTNDVFGPIRLHCDNVTEYVFSIYDRWGKEVFSSTDPSATWDGGNLPRDVYVYILTYKAELSGQEQVVRKVGDVTLIR